jgi:plastocyanin
MGMLPVKIPAAFPVAACVALICVACGGGSTPSSPSPADSGSSGGGGTSGGTTFTITSSGVSPKTITIAAGTQVTFLNSDNTVHDMDSDPHPAHTDCPEINNVGFLTPGQSKQTNPMRTVRTCGFHDHNQPSNSSLMGTIVVQ